MKGFKSTGCGPKYGDHTFSSKNGFTGSSGEVRKVRGYSQAVPVLKKAGGAVNSCGGKAPPKKSGKGSSFFQDLMAKKRG